MRASGLYLHSFSPLIELAAFLRPIHPIFDGRYWQLISSLNLSQEPAWTTAERRPAKTWLTPLLHRIPLGLIQMLESLTPPGFSMLY